MGSPVNTEQLPAAVNSLRPSCKYLCEDLPLRSPASRPTPHAHGRSVQTSTKQRDCRCLLGAVVRYGRGKRSIFQCRSPRLASKCGSPAGRGELLLRPRSRRGRPCLSGSVRLGSAGRRRRVGWSWPLRAPLHFAAVQRFATPSSAKLVLHDVSGFGGKYIFVLEVHVVIIIFSFSICTPNHCFLLF